MLRLTPDADLSAFVVTDDGYSSVERGSTVLYPVVNADGQLYFTRRPDGATQVLVDYRQPVTA